MVKSAERTLLVFEYFSLMRQPTTASEIAAALDLPQSSTSVLLRYLTEQGYLEYNRIDRRYLPTARVVLFSDWLKPSISRNLVGETLSALGDQTGESVVIARQQRMEVHVVHVLLPNREVRFDLSADTRRPLWYSASGRALMSALSDQMVLRLAHHFKTKAAANGRSFDAGSLIACIRRIRETGISEHDPKIDDEPDIAAFAMLIPRDQHSEQYTVAVGGPRERMLRRREEIITIMRDWIARSRDHAEECRS